MPRLVKRAVLAVAIVASLAVPATAATASPYLGVYGNTAFFVGLQGAGHPVRHVIAGWNQGETWGSPLRSILSSLGPVPMLGLTTSQGWPNPRETITPRAIALGAGDRYLFAVTKAVSEYGSLVYVRPLAEMDSYKNAYCAFNANGSARSSAHSTANFRKAFARIYVLLHGGSRDAVNARLRRLGLPGIADDLPLNPTSRLRVIWNPLGFSEPKRRGNTPADYYPGDAYVDVVGGDVYKTPTNVGHLTALDGLYRAHPRKPFAIPEWGLQSVDDPDFVRRVARFIWTHRRTEVVVYFNRGAEYDLATKPSSRAAYRRHILPLGRRL
jgi:Glycosyl hydrolase family 26